MNVFMKVDNVWCELATTPHTMTQTSFLPKYIGHDSRSPFFVDVNKLWLHVCIKVQTHPFLDFCCLRRYSTNFNCRAWCKALHQEIPERTHKAIPFSELHNAPAKSRRKLRVLV